MDVGRVFLISGVDGTTLSESRGTDIQEYTKFGSRVAGVGEVDLDGDGIPGWLLDA